MKLSNKVLLVFFGFILLYMTAAFAEIRLRGTHYSFYDKNSIAETVDLAGISHVIINDLDRNLKIASSDRSRLEVRSLTGDVLEKVSYEISGDTLRVTGWQAEDTPRVTVTVFVLNERLKEITLNRSMVTIEGLKLGLLHVSQSAGRTWFRDNKIASVDLELSNGYLDISDGTLDTLSVAIDASEVQVNSPVGLVQGSLENNSFLRLKTIREINVKKDSTSRMNLFE